MCLRNSFVILLVFLSYVFANTNSKYRVIGGSNWDIRNSPYVVAIFINVNNIACYRCVGTLITWSKVLTSENCLKTFDPPRITVKASIANLQTKGVERFAERIIYSSDWIGIMETMDLAVIVLTKKYRSSSTINTIPLCETDLNQGVKLRVFGWGSKDPKIEQPWPVLQSAEFEVVSINECAACYGANYAAVGKRFPTTLICLRDKAQASDVCSGDAGAPAVWNGKLCAVLSGGVECLNPNYPTLYTSLRNDNVKDFIEYAKRA